jgi:hypothetical protein
MSLTFCVTLDVGLYTGYLKPHRLKVLQTVEANGFYIVSCRWHHRRRKAVVVGGTMFSINLPPSPFLLLLFSSPLLSSSSLPSGLETETRPKLSTIFRDHPRYVSRPSLDRDVETETTSLPLVIKFSPYSSPLAALQSIYSSAMQEKVIVSYI